MTTARVDGREVSLSNLDKVLFPDVGITKGEVVRHHLDLADRLLPHLRDRYLVLRRYPDGIDHDGFFQKQAPDHLPDWIRTARIDKREGGSTDHIVCDDAATLAVVANLGTIELHTLLAPVGRPSHPDRLIIDLDPSTEDLSPVVEGARALRRLLRSLDVRATVSSTGSRGVHVHVLLDGEATFDDTRELAGRLADAVVDAHPDRFTTAHRKADRGDRLFLDVLRNGYGQHAVVPFSLRARPGAPVSVPLRWSEATSSSFDPRHTTLRTVQRRLAAQRSDPWTGRERHRYSVASLHDRLDRHQRGGR